MVRPRSTLALLVVVSAAVCLPPPPIGAQAPSTSPGAAGTEATTHDLDSVDDRHRFLGFATLLLAGLSAVGVLYAALAAIYFETCR